MHQHDDPELLASYADVLVGELPGTWTSAYHPSDHKDELAELTQLIWDLDLVAESLADHPLRRAAVLTRADGAQLVVLDRHDARIGFLIGAVASLDVPDEAYRGVREPNGIALPDDPFHGAGLVATDLLARYDAALAQVRLNAAPDPSEPDRVVLTWQVDGSLVAASVSEQAAAVLAATGFVRDQQSDRYRLSGDDTAAQARAVRETGRQLDACGIAIAVQHPSGRVAPTATAPAAPPTTVAARSAAARAR